MLTKLLNQIKLTLFSLEILLCTLYFEILPYKCDLFRTIENEVIYCTLAEKLNVVQNLIQEI
jgi:hypothetical protein